MGPLSVGIGPLSVGMGPLSVGMGPPTIYVLFLIQTSMSATSIMVGVVRRAPTVWAPSLAAVGVGLC